MHCCLLHFGTAPQLGMLPHVVLSDGIVSCLTLPHFHIQAILQWKLKDTAWTQSQKLAMSSISRLQHKFTAVRMIKSVQTNNKSLIQRVVSDGEKHGHYLHHHVTNLYHANTVLSNFKPVMFSLQT